MSQTTATQSDHRQSDELDQERRDLLQTLRTHRELLIGTARGLSEEQARARSTVSELSVGGLIKHVSATEEQWAAFITDGAAAFGLSDDVPQEEQYAAWADGFSLTDEDTLEGVIAEYRQVAERTDALVATVDLDAGHELPEAPWFTPGEVRSARRSLLHIVAETSQHAGHADIVREAIDGQKSMG